MAVIPKMPKQDFVEWINKVADLAGWTLPKLFFELPMALILSYYGYGASAEQFFGEQVRQIVSEEKLDEDYD